MTDKSLELSRRNIVLIAVLFEVPLMLPFVLKAIFYNASISLSQISTKLLIESLFYSLVLLFVNIIFCGLVYRFKVYSIISFLEGVVEPLARSLNIYQAMIVAIFAGLGEEFFFRGFLLPITGLMVSSLLFAVLHFFYEIRKYLLLIVVYSLIGLVFGVLYERSNNIWLVVFFHSMYDFLALIYFKSRFSRNLK
ncbi:MAG: CPBP family intramembrane metalloprotease, partial [Romboutsia sp.]|nr:CPBP family intramembrane metalloprotease [Romboutsia sp.]